MSTEMEDMAVMLEQSGDYKILRRLQPPQGSRSCEGTPTRRGLILDLETTGLDPVGGNGFPTDEIIEIALLPFDFNAAFEIVEVFPPYQSLREPSKPIPPKIETLTGISDDMVRGHTIDIDRVLQIIEPVDFVIAHNARFDRLFAERLIPAFAAKNWACSLSQVDWAAAGFEGSKLAYLLTAAGFFNARHRALDDCHALLELLARPLSGMKQQALQQLVEAAEKPTIRIHAEGAPFERKDLLKARSYRWNAGGNGQPKAWSLDVPDGEQDTEIAFLRDTIFGPDWTPRLKPVTAIDRFSDRA